jgi:hypothetical protein
MIPINTSNNTSNDCEFSYHLQLLNAAISQAIRFELPIRICSIQQWLYRRQAETVSVVAKRT